MPTRIFADLFLQPFQHLVLRSSTLVHCEYKYAGRTSEYKDGTIHRIEFPRANYEPTVVSLARVKGRIYCVGASCSHYSAPMYHGVVDGFSVTCPWHDAAFDLRTGRPIRGPVLDAIPTYKVKVDKGDIYVDIPTTAEPDFVVPKWAARDPSNNETYAIIGGGACASAACEELRSSGFTGRIVLISSEPHLPIDRPVLSKNMKKKTQDLLLRDEAFLLGEVLSVEAKLGCKVQSIDHKSKIISYKQDDALIVNARVVGFAGTSDQPQKSAAELAGYRTEAGKDRTLYSVEFPYTTKQNAAKKHHPTQTLRYDKVLICTGGTARLPPQIQDVHLACTLRTAQDAAYIDSVATPGAKVVVIGSGFIGMETASTLHRKGCDVTVVTIESVPFENILGTHIGKAIGNFFASKGIKFITDVSAQAITGSDKATGVTVKPKSGGEMNVSADLCVLGAGIIPNGNVIDDVEKAPDKSILVDPWLRTSAPDVFAGGDVVTVVKGEEKRRIEHFHLAQTHGRLAARSMLGLQPLETSDTIVPFFWTVLYGRILKYVGYCRKFDDVLVQGSVDQMKFIAYYCDGNEVKAVVSMGAAEPVCAAAGELMRRGEMITKDDIVNEINPIERLRQLNIKDVPEVEASAE